MFIIGYNITCTNLLFGHSIFMHNKNLGIPCSTCRCANQAFWSIPLSLHPTVCFLITKWNLMIMSQYLIIIPTKLFPINVSAPSSAFFKIMLGCLIPSKLPSTMNLFLLLTDNRWNYVQNHQNRWNKKISQKIYIMVRKLSSLSLYIILGLTYMVLWTNFLFD